MSPEDALPTRLLAAGTSMVQTKPWNSDTVTPQSPAIRVMTDLTLVKPATIGPQASLHEAEQVMIFQGVRMLFVVTAMPALDGLITTHDLHGERATRMVQQRGVRHDELTVADVMNSLTSLEAIDLDAVRRSTVANLIATLRRHGRHHMLVVDNGASRIRGVISRTQIERQLGSAIEIPEVAHSFAELGQMLS